MSYTYDKADRRATMTVEGQPTVTYGYDEANRLTSVTQGPSTVTITYDEADRRGTLTLPNGIVTTYGYDEANQLTSLVYSLAQTTLGTLTYTYDLAGRRTEVGGTWARTGLPASATDAVYDHANRLIQWADSILTYDVNGNLASDGLTSYVWDARNRLSTISGRDSAAFQYDSVGRRISKTASGQTLQFLYDGSNAVQELSNNAPIATILSGIEPDELWERNDAQGLRFYLVDALASTIAQVDSSGTSVTQYTYEPFGNTQSAGAPSSNPSQFTGRENDAPGSGLYFYRARLRAATRPVRERGPDGTPRR